MKTHSRTPGPIPAATCIVVGLLLAGCGSSSSKTTSVARSAPAATPTRTAVAAAAKPASVHILSPAAGSNTASTVTVHVRVTGGAGGSVRLRYLLDGRLSRHGATRLTYRELAPGRHTVLVSLVGDSGVRAARSFVVRAPVPAPVEASHAAPAEPAPSGQMGASEHERSTSPPEPTHSERKPSAPETGGIPQGNGGDHDADNNGGPSDGDGNV